MAHWQDAIDDYDQTAALVSALDLTISVCTAVVHLAGALGRPVWVMAPQARSGAMAIAAKRCRGTLGARIQAGESGDWEPVMKRVTSELHALQRSSFGGAGLTRR